jgi:hypothetical protein
MTQLSAGRAVCRFFSKSVPRNQILAAQVAKNSKKVFSKILIRRTRYRYRRVGRPIFQNSCNGKISDAYDQALFLLSESSSSPAALIYTKKAIKKGPEKGLFNVAGSRIELLTSGL